MSQRTTNKLGAATASGDGGDGSPVETDPLGGSVGTSTPYIQQFNSGWEPSPEYPMLHSYFDDAPQYVNGQRVSATLDGIAISYGQAMNMVRNGSAAQCPNNYCGPQVFQARQPDGSYKNVLSRPFQAFADGTSGYMVPKWSKSAITVDGVTEWGKAEISWTFYQTKNDESIWDIFKMVLNQYSCDKKIARIFGDEDAVIATAVEPTTLVNENGTRHSVAGLNRINPGGNPNPRESPTNGVAHLYATKTGQGKENGFAYTPPGYTGKPGMITAPNPNSTNETQTNFSFVYLPGALSRYGYDGGLRINFVHSGTTDAKGQLLPPDPSVTNSEGSIKVGLTGNFGMAFETGGNGTRNSFVHNHMLFNVVDKRGRIGRRIDPRSVFCKDLGF